jgi:Nucleotidyltransferase of unknown function (DUF6036)
MSEILTKEALYQAFVLLSGRLVLMHSEPVRLVICGGSALIAMGFLQRTTNDADVVAMLSENGELISPDPLPPALLEASALVARDLGLSENWLNNEPSRNEGGLFQMGLPQGFAHRLTKQGFGSRLTIYYIGRLDQIYFKLYAVADQRDDTHIADLRALKPTETELEDAARWAMTHDVSEGFRMVLIELLNQMGYESAAKNI